MNMSMEMSKIEPIGEETEGTLSGFYPSTFVYSRFFPMIEFFYCLDLQIVGKCISDTFFEFKA